MDARERADIEPEAAALGVTVAALDALGAIVAAGGANCAVVVASQGHYDEEALEASLGSPVPYVGLVASRKRGATVRALLEERGVPRLATIRNPAGLDLGARTPQEVALSILAEIVQTLPGATGMAAAGEAAAPRPWRHRLRRPPRSIRCAECRSTWRPHGTRRRSTALSTISAARTAARAS